MELHFNIDKELSEFELMPDEEDPKATEQDQDNQADNEQSDNAAAIIDTEPKDAVKLPEEAANPTQHVFKTIEDIVNPLRHTMKNSIPKSTP